MRYVAGEGPVPCRVAMIGEGPGFEEDRLGAPFKGRSGRLLDRILFREGICRDEIYVTNLVKYRVPNDGDPTMADIARDADDLAEELSAVEPEIVGLLGAVATRHFLPSDVNLEWAHGLPFSGDLTKVLGRSSPNGSSRNGSARSKILFVPCYHPALGLHSADALPLVEDDLHQFARLVKGKMSPEELAGRRDEFTKPNYKELDNGDCQEITAWFASSQAKIYIDTEGYHFAPWGLSYTDRAGWARVIHRSSRRALQSFRHGLRTSGRAVCLHNSLHDIEVLAGGFSIEGYEFIDTMIEAYLLCLEPQGLKPLARRYAGMKQDSYEDIIGPANEAKALSYLKDVMAWANKHLPNASPVSSKTRRKPARRVKKSTSARAGRK